ncbi:thermonuclease family protein [Corallococcus sp. ZKHCc1 1396]|uniref:Thermonuclease family protein n=1 Tax=Corallococcus soli TaxID=2710757 RepID=A0ABR9PG98_9BACT|nr:thermonuclease family protein [Corallococcus soli]
MLRGGFGLLISLLLACGGEEGACGPVTGVVTQVIDGDTVVLQDGERIRYLLADTPETTRGHHDCFGEEAAAFNRSLVEGRTVRLRDAEACTDRFGRRLAYVSVDGHDVNALLVERGYACTLFVPPAGTSRRGEFEALEVEARRARRGMWGRCPAPCPKGRRPSASALRQRVRHGQLQLPVQRPRRREARRGEVQRVVRELHPEGVAHEQPHLAHLLLEHRSDVGRRGHVADDRARALDEPRQRLHGAGLIQVRARAELRRHRRAPGGGQLVGHGGQVPPQVHGRGLRHRPGRRGQHGRVVQRDGFDDAVRHERHIRALAPGPMSARRVQQHAPALPELAVLPQDAHHLAPAAQVQRHLRQVQGQAFVAA